MVPPGEVPQTPLVHLAPPRHTLPQRPQWLVLSRWSTQTPSQRVCPVGQSMEVTQVPLTHNCPREQALPQEPQLVEALRLASQPLLAFPSQSAKPVAQRRVHTPAEHA